MCVHGEYVWDHIGVVGHNCELGHGKEAKRAAGDCCQSYVHARTVKRQTKTKIWRGGERAGCRVAGAN